MTGFGPRRRAALAVLCTVNFMVILDSQIVLLALPSIEDDLGFASGGSQWVLSAYLLGFGGLLLLGGRAADLLGRRRLFLAGLVLFGVSSLGCGLAWSPAALVAARVLQGMSAAMLAPSALALLMTTFDDGAERTRALAVWGGTGGFGATAALLAGGALTRALGWPWIFFLNVPVALALLLVTPLVLRESRERVARQAFDLPGAVTVTAGLACGLWALTRLSLVALVLSVALLTLFAVLERRAAAPLVPLRLFRIRTLTGGNLVMVAAAAGAFGTSLLVSEHAQRVLGYSPMVFGLLGAALPVMAVAGSAVAQAVVPRSGFRPVAFGALLLLIAGGLTLAGPGSLLPGLALFGFGLGAAGVAGSSAALSGVASDDAGVASGITTAAFQIGGAIGVAVVAGAAYRTGLFTAAALVATGLVVSAAVLGRARAEADVVVENRN